MTFLVWDCMYDGIRVQWNESVFNFTTDMDRIRFITSDIQLIRINHNKKCLS